MLPDGLPDMTGVWYNPSTGDKIKVKDTFFEDNELRVITEDGRMLDYEIMQNYIKSTKEDDNLTDIIKSVQQKQYEEGREKIPQSVKDLLEDFDTTNNRPISTVNAPEITGVPQRVVQENDINYTIIDKALGKKPCFNFTAKGLSWNDFPVKEINMLHEIMGIEYDDIINYYISKIDINNVKDIIKNCVTDYIHQTRPDQEKFIKPQKPESKIKKVKK